MFQVHYTPTGKIKTDRSKVGFIFSKTKPTREAFTLGIANADLILPAGSANVEVASSKEMPFDVRVLSFMPHMHLRGKDFKYTFTRPGGSPETVLSVPAFDFAWQTYYVLKDPIELPKGSVIDCLAHFDNSDSNPYNPDPTKMVRWGDQTFEEMMIGYLDLDVPVGSEIIRSNDFRPRSEKAAMNTTSEDASSVQSRPSIRQSKQGRSTERREAMIRRIFAIAAFVFAFCAAEPNLVACGSDDAADTREIPAPFAPLEYLIGKWKGQAVPKESGAQQFRGWEEKHGWAWIFNKGKPAGLSFTIEGGKVVASGKLTFDPSKKLYRVDGKEPGIAGRRSHSRASSTRRARTSFSSGRAREQARRHQRTTCGSRCARTPTTSDTR